MPSATTTTTATATTFVSTDGGQSDYLPYNAATMFACTASSVASVG